jgi:endonuclease/exonuclease/phosphatase family metal-dependent hydrolase
MKNYTDPHSPPSTGDYAAPPSDPPGDLIVVTYNLRYGEAIGEMIEAFQTVEPLPEAGIILLQEMDAAGVETVARELGYNYVYYPASVAADGDDFGNAILARWPLSDSVKLILPGLHPITGQGRTATRATVTIGGTEVLVYSTHVEVATAPPSFRVAQFAALLDDIPDDAAHVIVGGDFNTVTARGVGSLAELYATGGLAHDSADLGPTYTRFGLRPSAADHIFSRGFERLGAGVLSEVTASDHFPVWVRLAFPPR